VLVGFAEKKNFSAAFIERNSVRARGRFLLPDPGQIKKIGILLVVQRARRRWWAWTSLELTTTTEFRQQLLEPFAISRQTKRESIGTDFMSE